MTLTWFGWLYLAFAIYSTATFIVKAGRPRGPYPVGAELLIALVIYGAIVAGLFFVGVTA